MVIIQIFRQGYYNSMLISYNQVDKICDAIAAHETLDSWKYNILSIKYFDVTRVSF